MNASELQNIPLSKLIADPQIRTRNGFDAESIGELASSIEANGLLQPLLVRPNTAGGESFIVVAGHRRLAALHKLNSKTAPCLVTWHETPTDALPSQLVENLQRVDLCLADLVQGVREIAEALATPEKVGKALGKSKSWVSKHLAVTGPKFNPRACELVTSGFVSDLEAAHAYHQIATAKGNDDKRAKCIAALERHIAERGGLSRSFAIEQLESFKASKADTTDDLDLDGDDDEASDDTRDADGPMVKPIRLSPKQYALYLEKGGIEWLVNLLVA